MKYTHKQFKQQFPTDDSCLDYMYNQKYGKSFECPKCSKKGFYKVKQRKCYACKCGYQIHPLANTIFHKSSTKLTDWFFAIYIFSASKNGTSAKELERHLGCTYKTAWRIAKKIRELMKEGYTPLKGVVEIDEAYIGAKSKNKIYKKAKKKTAVLGMVERQGRVNTQIVEDTGRKTLRLAIKDKVQVGSNIITDNHHGYHKIGEHGYKHDVIDHSKNDYVLGNLYTNTIEGFWSQMKRSIDGTYHAVSKKYLQTYLNEFSYRYNHRASEFSLFELLIGSLCEKHAVRVKKTVPCLYGKVSS